MKPSLREDITSLLAIATSTVVAAALTAALVLREPQHEPSMVSQPKRIPVVVTAHEHPPQSSRESGVLRRVPLKDALP
jgi:hypothetical protein